MERDVEANVYAVGVVVVLIGFLWLLGS